jgi:hypothetical protein
MLAREPQGMNMAAPLTLVLAVALLFLPGRPLPCAAGGGKGEACLHAFDSCVTPCKPRCRTWFPASSWAWWREREFSECVDRCLQACWDERTLCGQGRTGAR